MWLSRCIWNFEWMDFFYPCTCIRKKEKILCIHIDLIAFMLIKCHCTFEYEYVSELLVTAHHLCVAFVIPHKIIPSSFFILFFCPWFYWQDYQFRIITEKLKDIEKQTGHSKVYFFALAVSILSSALYALGGGKLCTDLVTFIYPAYMSFKAIDSANSSEHTQWWDLLKQDYCTKLSKWGWFANWFNYFIPRLTYWVVYSFFSITESVAGFLTEFIPFYFIIKICFFVYLYHPKFMGAGLVYTQVIKPFVMPHLEALTKTVSSTTKKVE